MTEHVKRSTSIERSDIPVDFRRDGVLYLINKAVFHPRGFALAYDDSTGEFFLQGDGKESWTFSCEIEDKKFEAVEKLFKRAKKHNR